MPTISCPRENFLCATFAGDLNTKRIPRDNGKVCKCICSIPTRKFLEQSRLTYFLFPFLRIIVFLMMVWVSSISSSSPLSPSSMMYFRELPPLFMSVPLDWWNWITGADVTTVMPGAFHQKFETLTSTLHISSHEISPNAHRGTIFGVNSPDPYKHTYFSAGGKVKLTPFGQMSLHSRASLEPEHDRPPLKFNLAVEQRSVPYWHCAPLKSLVHWQTLYDKQLPPFIHGGSQVAESIANVYLRIKQRTSALNNYVRNLESLLSRRSPSAIRR